jgi:subtilase family serine protease
LNFGGPLGATGGGCSLFITAPAWQQHLAAWPKTVCGTKRLANDIAAVADPFTGFDTYNTSDGGTGWGTIGGTSLSAPVVAAMWALAGGASGVSSPALTLYGHLGSTALYNVTTGGDGFCGGEGAAQCGDANQLTFNGVALGTMDCDYPATGTTPSAGTLACDAAAGFNGPSGVGTPKGVTTFKKTGATATITGPTTIAHGTSGTWNATTVKDPFPGGTVTSYSWNWGDGTAATVTTTPSASHIYAAAGTHTITLSMTDSYGQVGTATHNVTIS